MNGQARKGYFRTYFDERALSNLRAYRQADQSYLGHCYKKRLSICLEWIQQKHLPSQCGALLDVGCGASPLVQEITKLGYSAWGIDHSFKSIQDGHAELKGKHIQSDAEALPFLDGSFDVVCCLGVLCYLPSDHIALGELNRVTRKGGIMILSLPQKINLSAIADLSLYLRKRLVAYFTPQRQESSKETESCIQNVRIPFLRSTGF